ncbi:MAG: flagellar biosynthesis anti-sigma factor FlgM [Firmicutes bacterium]|nr:flagellar biosynthesis anti-sigma factor FlgM [Bacillota bacterium]
MKVNSSSYSQLIKRLNKQKAETKYKNKKKETTKDRIELSTSSKALNTYKNQMKNTKAKKAETVARIKNEISSGSYKVSSEKLAKKIIEKMNKQ